MYTYTFGDAAEREARLQGGKRRGRSIGGLQSRLAGYLLQVGEGERIESVRRLAALNRTSVGSVSNALTELGRKGAVRIDRHGRSGSFVGTRSLGILFELAEREPLIIAFTLPTNPRYEGLATALKTLLSQAGLEVYLVFVRGARNRLLALRTKRCHIAVMSVSAADQDCSDKETVSLRLPPGSWSSDHRVYYRPLPQESGKPLRVAIDFSSLDHKLLTETEFSDKQVELVPISYVQIHRLLLEGRVDAAIWSADDMEDYFEPRILSRPISEKTRCLVGQGDTSAALVTRSSNHSVRAAIRTLLKAEVIAEIQQKVMAGDVLPEY